MAVGGKERRPSKEGKPRRVCVVTDAIDHGGQDGAMVELARLFAEDGDDVTLLWVPGRNAPAAEAARHRDLEAASVRLEILDKSDQLLPSLTTWCEGTFVPASDPKPGRLRTPVGIRAHTYAPSASWGTPRAGLSPTGAPA